MAKKSIDKKVLKQKLAEKGEDLYEFAVKRGDRLHEFAQKRGEELHEIARERGEDAMNHMGDLVENSLGKAVQDPKRLAPVLEGKPIPMTWYCVPVKTGISGDGSEYHVYVKRGFSDHLCVFFSGGGMAWNEYTAARPITGGKVAAGLPNYYWNNLRPFTQIMNINMGITDVSDETNPFREWSFVVITYSTGDLHVGDGEFEYEAVDSTRQILHFHGYRNFLSGMEICKNLFPSPDKLLIAGNSAGAFAVSALSEEVMRGFYPDVRDITLLSDSGQLLYKDWLRTARDVWKSPEWIWQSIDSDNITLSWFRRLHRNCGRRFKYLYASSVRDYLLSAYYSDVTYKQYKTDTEVREAFYRQLCDMVKQLKEIDEGFGIFLNDWKIPLVTKGGTVHTSVREPYFTRLSQDGITMAKWLQDAVDGNIRDVGMDLLDVKT